MGIATILTKEQMDFLSSDLAEMIEKIILIEKNFDATELKKDIKESVIQAISEGSLTAALEQDNFELDQNLRELKKVKKYFLECANQQINKMIVISLLSIIVGAGIATVLIKFF